MRQALPPGYGQRRARRAIGLWLALGALAWVVLPWYLPQDLGLGASLARAWGGAETASALVQVGRHGRPWLLAGALGLLAAALAWRLPTGRAQGAWLVGGTASALLVLLGCGFAIGAQGWAFESLGSWLGSAPRGQPGIGLGGALVLAALLVLLGMGLARLGSFHGDLFVGASVVACGALLALFIVLPVGKALVGAALDDSGQPSLAALAERLGSERVWGLSCLASLDGTGLRCGAVHDVMFLRDGQALRVGDLVLHAHKHQVAGAPAFVADRFNARGALHRIAHQQGVVLFPPQTPASPHAARQRHRGQKAAARRVAVGP